MSKKSRQTRRHRIARNLQQRSRRALQVERLEDRNLLNADNPFHNLNLPNDANLDERVTPLDVLAIINGINGKDSDLKTDVNGDGHKTALDALAVINDINAGEGENGTVLSVIVRIFERPVDYPFDGQGNRVEATNPITEVGVGQDFVVKLLVEDVRSMSTREGVFSTYVDVDFDNPAVASVVGSLPGVVHPQTGASTPYLHNNPQFSFGYGQGAQPDAGTGLIDTDDNGSLDQIDFLGSFASSINGPGPGEFVLVEWAMTAEMAGDLTIIASPTTQNVAIDPNDADESPLRDAGIYGQDAPVCPSESTSDPCMGDMGFISDTITVFENVSAKPDSFVVAEDAGGQTLNVLANDEINTEGMLTISNPLGMPSMGGSVVNNGSNITYTPALNFFGTETFTYTITNGMGDSSSTTVSLEVTPVNDGPVNSIPGSLSVNEDTSLVINGGTLSVSDVDADAGNGLQVDLTVANGSLTVGTTGATVTNDGTASVGIAGSIADVNAALNGLTYTPNSDFNGSDSLSITSNDQGNFGSGGSLSDTDLVNITINPINDAPVNSVPGSQNLFNTEILSFVGGTDVIVWSDPFTIADVDADALEVTLTVNEGTLQFGSGGTPSNSLTASGSKASINSQLGTLIYDPVDDFIGNATLTMTTSDLGNTGAAPPAQTNPLTDTSQVTISVAPPKAPFAAADFFDLEEDPNSDLSFNLSELLANDLVPLGSTSPLVLKNINAMSPSASPFTTAQGGSLSFDEGNGTFTYTPVANFFGLDTFTYTIDLVDTAQGDGESIGTVNIDVQPINDGPINSVPGPLSIDEDNSLSFSGANLIEVQDIDAGSDGITVTLTVGVGTLSVSTGGGGTVTNNDSGTVTLDGTVAEVNNQLGGLTYTPNEHFFGSDMLTMNTNDNGNTGGAMGNPNSSNPLSDSDTVNITIQSINDAPVIVVPSSQTFITNFDNFLSNDRGNALSVSDVDAGSDDLQVDLTIDEGTLTLADTSGLSITGDGTNAVTLTGSVTALNTALGAGVNYRTSLEGPKTLTATVNDFVADPVIDNIAVTVIDFVPSEIGGSVFVDLDNDTTRGDAEPGLATIEITLSGTTLRGTPVDLQTLTDRNGQYLFTNLEPGNYVLNQPNQTANMNNGTNSFSTAVVAAENDRANVTIPIAGDVHSMQNNYAERGLSTPFISLYDFAASQFQRSGALLSTDGLTSWTAFFGPGWTNYSNPRVDLVTMTLTMTDGSGTDRVVDLTANDPARDGRTQMDRVTVRQSGDNQVIRLSGSAANFGLPAEGEGEGDLADVQGADSSEMFAQAVDSIFGEMA